MDVLFHFYSHRICTVSFMEIYYIESIHILHIKKIEIIFLGSVLQSSKKLKLRKSKIEKKTTITTTMSNTLNGLIDVIEMEALKQAVQRLRQDVDFEKQRADEYRNELNLLRIEYENQAEDLKLYKKQNEKLKTAFKIASEVFLGYDTVEETKKKRARIAKTASNDTNNNEVEIIQL